MSGHSKWSTIKRAKGAADSKRAVVFAKLSKKITVASREDGGEPSHNFKLRLAIEKAKAASMPNDNIERAIKKGSGVDNDTRLEEITYEAYGPAGTALLIETTTDNKNRTVQLIKHILSKHGGSFGSQGSVSWQFALKGQVIVNRSENIEAIELAAIEAGALDIDSSEDGLIIYTDPIQYESIKNVVVGSGASVADAEIVQISMQPVTVTEHDQNKVTALITALEENDDVTAVHTNMA